MTQSASIPCAAPAAVTAARFTEGFRWMLLARTVEDKIAALYHAGKIVGGVYLGRGQEAFSAALAMNLDRAHGDIFAPLIRDQAGRMAFGAVSYTHLRAHETLAGVLPLRRCRVSKLIIRDRHDEWQPLHRGHVERLVP